MFLVKKTPNSMYFDNLRFSDIPLNIECFMDDKDVSGRMNRGKLEEMGASVLTAIEQHMRAILDYSSTYRDTGYITHPFHQIYSTNKKNPHKNMHSLL